MSSTQKEYIGAGVYAELEGGMIKLTTVTYVDGSRNVIYLEPEVYRGLVAYANRVWGLGDGKP